MNIPYHTLLGKLASLRDLREDELQQVAGGDDDQATTGNHGQPDRYHMCAPTGSDWVGTDCD